MDLGGKAPQGKGLEQEANSNYSAYFVLERREFRAGNARPGV